MPKNRKKDSKSNLSLRKSSWDEFHEIVLGKEEKEIERLKWRLDDKENLSDEIGLILPDAIKKSMSKNDDLTNTLIPVFEEATKISVKNNVKSLADALFPIMGPAIRKAIAEAFKNMLQTFNKALENSFSMRGIRWRIESIITGRSFGEIVLLNSLIYRVEQVFLINKQDGLLLSQVQIPSIEFQEGDMVSGMLTAIQDFVHDSFKVEHDNELDSIQVGDLKVWIVQGPYAIIAAVIRGEAPGNLRKVMQICIEKIHLDFNDQFQEFDGDTDSFIDSSEYLSECLQEQVISEESKLPLPAIISLVFIFLIIVSSMFLNYSKIRKWNNCIQELNDYPGIVIINHSIKNRKYAFNGLKDPLSIDPALVFGSYSYLQDDIKANWMSYVSLDPEIMLLRIERKITPPSSVNIQYEDNIIELSGKADFKWIKTANRILENMEGITAIETYNLKVLEELEINDFIQKIEKTKVYFDHAKTKLSGLAKEKLFENVRNIKEITRDTEILSLTPIITIEGYTDSTGTTRRNQYLSNKRAENVYNFLLENGIDQEYITFEGKGFYGEKSAEIIKNQKEYRCVRFSVKIIEKL